MSGNRKRCFVIMPFSETSEGHTEEYWTNHFESFLKPTIEECGNLEAYRSEPLRGDVLKQIITDIIVSPVIVADLTDLNPNVFWELGVRQSFSHGSVTIAEKGTKIPFDISAKGVLFYYPKNHIKNSKFMKRFKKAIKDCLSHPESPDSHVLESISGRGTLFEIMHLDEMVRRVEGVIDECEYNKTIIDKMYEDIEKPDEKTIPTVRLQSCSLELLITQRYLEEAPSFYDNARNWFMWIAAINDQIVLWVETPKIIEEWFTESKRKELFLKRFKQFKKGLEAARKKLAARH